MSDKKRKKVYDALIEGVPEGLSGASLCDFVIKKCSKTTSRPIVRASLRALSVSVFGIFKYTKDTSLHRYIVRVHLLVVDQIAKDYPEMRIRRAKRFAIDAAIREVC
ncbi:hypothetical protein [Rhizobium tubonense]|uniref:Uncharacterized protein n=1 Tax=Rhizobium tubonense TaxID=484088 RepID=A0A2W4EW10_9HYPH|nr:hypothetical protein [Rhizobium tubonense]PZM14823.1 hypothetical protein CPY51_08915 [Rhizobium tubonense]